MVRGNGGTSQSRALESRSVSASIISGQPECASAPLPSENSALSGYGSFARVDINTDRIRGNKYEKW